MDIKKKIGKLLEPVLIKLGYDKNLSTVNFSTKPNVDLQCNSAFVLAKQVGKNSVDIASKIAEEFNKNNKEITASNIGGFVNFVLSNKYLSKVANEIKNDKNLGVEKHTKSRTIIMDYGGANVAKELHVGHLRSPIIGESLKRLYIMLGDKVISDSHLGDWGMQMGLTIAQLEEDGYLDYYFNKGKKIDITLDMLNEEYPKASARKKTDSKFKQKADDYTLYVQQKREPYYSIYNEIRKASVKAIERNYKMLNSYYDLWYGESTAQPYIEEVIQIFKDKGLTRESNGALVVDVAREGEHIPLPKKNPDDPNEEVQYKNPMPPAIIQKYNGGDLYATTDIATLYMRQKNFKFDDCFYLTDKRQALHFEQVFRCVRLAGIINDNQRLVHIGFGTMNGKDGKPFKTRDGGTIKLEDIIKLLISKAKEKLEENKVEYDDKLALAIGVAAMKFGDLSNIVSKDYVFDLDKFLSFEGKTGPYLQYTAVRIKSILKKAKDNLHDINISTQEEKNIIMNIFKVLDCYEICYQDKSLNALCNNLYNLASAFSTFYNNIKILSEQDEKKRISYLTLSKLVLDILSQGLYVLAIDIPERM